MRINARSDRLAVVALICALVPTVFGVLAFGGVYSWAWASADLLLFAATVLVLALAWKGNLRLPLHPVLFPAAVFWMLGLAQWLFHISVDRGATLTQIIQLAGNGCVLLLALLAFRRAENLRRLGWVIWSLAAGISVEAILQTLTAHDRIYWFHDASYATPVGPFVYHNHFAGCLCLLLPVTFAIAFRSSRTGTTDWTTWLRRALVPCLTGVALMLSLSRGGMLCVAFEGLLAMAWFVRRPATLLRPILLFVLLAGSFAALTNWHAMRDRFQLLEHKDASVEDRLRVSATCLQIFRHYPLFGAGMGTFPSVYPAYETFDLGLQFEQAHDEFAQTLAETGILGMLMVFAVLWMWYGAGRRLRHTAEGHLSTAVQSAAWISVAGLVLYSSWDFQFHSPGNGLLFFVLLGAALSPVPSASRTAATSPSSHSRRQEIEHGRMALLPSLPASAPREQTSKLS